MHVIETEEGIKDPLGFSGGQAVNTPHCQCSGCKLIFGQEVRPYVTWCSQKIKTKRPFGEDIICYLEYKLFSFPNREIFENNDSYFTFVPTCLHMFMLNLVIPNALGLTNYKRA